MRTETEAPFPWRGVVLTGFLPALLFAIGEGAIIPVIPLVADSLGATLAVAGFVAACLTIGELLGDIPAGWLVSRTGELPAMIGASGLSIVGLLLCVWAPHEAVLALGVLIVGLATAVFSLARHAFMTTHVPLRYRARALSALGGVFRAGFFVGPFLTAGVIALTGTPGTAFWVHAVLCVAAAGVLLVVGDPLGAARPASGSAPVTADTAELETVGGPAAPQAASRRPGLFSVVWQRRDVLVRLGSAAAIMQAMRASRSVVLPLWAVSIGVDPATTAIVIGIAGGIDFALFYTSGWIMDRFGRMWSAMPALLGLGVSHLVLSVLHDVPEATRWFVVGAMLMSLANGVGSGIVMTLGADLAPRHDPAPFLGAWRFTSTLGAAGAPLAIAGLTAIASLPIAVAVMGAVGLVGAGLSARYIPRYAPRPTRR